MSDTKFTPSPWWVEPETGDVVAKDGDWEICTFSRSDSEHEHDTNLIAAAPDLYEALETCLDCIGDEFAPPYDIIDEARVALAKARGEMQ